MTLDQYKINIYSAANRLQSYGLEVDSVLLSRHYWHELVGQVKSTLDLYQYTSGVEKRKFCGFDVHLTDDKNVFKVIPKLPL